MEDEQMLQRAMAAYFRYPQGDVLDQPDKASSGVEEHAGKRYVVLRNVKGVLATYRVKPDGLLRRLRRWPTAINTTGSGERER